MARIGVFFVLVCGLLSILQPVPTEAKRRKDRLPSRSVARPLTSSSHGSRRRPSQSNQDGNRLGTPCPVVNYTCPSSFSNKPLILIAMDGFRTDYLTRGLTPTLNRLSSQCGLKSQHMRPSFPTTTYPNLYTIVTGLFPESHGIIDNDVYDPVLRERIDKDRNWNNSIWWQKDPIWVSAEKQGKKTATYFWLGSDVSIHGVRPTHYKVYGPNHPWNNRVQTVLDWLDMPSASRPSFITLYFNQPDNDGHRHGPDSRQVNDTLRSLDSTIATLVNGLEQRRILSCVNVMIVSDHGMVGKSCNRVIPLDRFLNLSTVYYTTGAASRVRPKGRYNSSTVDALVNSLRCQSDKLLVAKKEELPKRFHFSDNPRIEPVVLGPTPGWVVRRDGSALEGNSLCTGGTHGYDNMAEDMKALFIAFGPAFKRNITVAPFSNIELYGLMTELIGITPEPNNGTRGSLHHLLVNPPSLPNTTQGDVCSAMPITSASSRTSTTCLCQSGTVAIPSVTRNASEHLVWGSPGCAPAQLDNQKSVVGHKRGQHLPTWVAFTLSQNNATTSTNITSSCWTDDPRLPSAGKCYPNNVNLTSLAPSDPGVPRLLSVASPMYSGFASGAYGHLIRLINQWSATGPINVITGPAFDYNGIGTLVPASSSPNLNLPTHYFAVLTRCTRPGVAQLSSCPTSHLTTLAFLLPHKENRENCLAPRPYLLYHACRIRDVEYLTGLKFFKNVDSNESARLRTMLPEALWS